MAWKTIFNSRIPKNVHLQEELDGYWSLNGNSQDLFGSNDGVDTSVSYVSDYVSFNGSSSWIRLNEFTSPVITFNTWVYFNSVSGIFQTIVRQGVSKIPFNLIVFDTGEVKSSVVGTLNLTTMSTGVILTTSQWYMLTGVWDWVVGDFKFYLNASLQYQNSSFKNTSGDHQLDESYAYADISRNVINNNAFVDGRMRKMSVHNRVLSEYEIKRLYANSRGLKLVTDGGSPTPGSQGPNSPSTVSTDSGNGGSYDWTNPSNAKVSDNSYATVDPNADLSYWLIATGFGFSIPGGATIKGITVEIERKQTSSGVFDAYTFQTKLVKGGSVSGNNLSLQTIWGTSDAYETAGDSTQLWGLSWTPADINASNFGVAISVTGDFGVTCHVDHIRIKIDYTT